MTLLSINREKRTRESTPEAAVEHVYLRSNSNWSGSDCHGASDYITRVRQRKLSLFIKIVT